MRTWERLCSAVQRHHAAGEATEALLGAVLESLERWPDTLRRCPKAWLPFFMSPNEGPPFLPLVRALSIDGSATSADHYALLASSAQLRHLTVLEAEAIPRAAAMLILRNPNLAGLHTLRLDYCQLDSAVIDLIASGTLFTTLRRLSLMHNRLVDLDVRTLMEAAWAEDLLECALEGNAEISPRILDHLHALAVHNTQLAQSA